MLAQFVQLSSEVGFLHNVNNLDQIVRRIRCNLLHDFFSGLFGHVFNEGGSDGGNFFALVQVRGQDVEEKIELLRESQVVLFDHLNQIFAVVLLDALVEQDFFGDVRETKSIGTQEEGVEVFTVGCLDRSHVDVQLGDSLVNSLEDISLSERSLSETLTENSQLAVSETVEAVAETLDE